MCVGGVRVGRCACGGILLINIHIRVYIIPLNICVQRFFMSGYVYESVCVCACVCLCVRVSEGVPIVVRLYPRHSVVKPGGPLPLSCLPPPTTKWERESDGIKRQKQTSTKEESLLFSQREKGKEYNTDTLKVMRNV